MGKRIGPAEVESILVGHKSVIEATAIGVPEELKSNALVAFCALVPGVAGDKKLEEEMRKRVAAELGNPLRPENIFFVQALPNMHSSKVIRRLIRAAFLGEDTSDTTALENRAAVEAIRQTVERSAAPK